MPRPGCGSLAAAAVRSGRFSSCRAQPLVIDALVLGLRGVEAGPERERSWGRSLLTKQVKPSLGFLDAGPVPARYPPEDHVQVKPLKPLTAPAHHIQVLRIPVDEAP